MKRPAARLVSLALALAEAALLAANPAWFAEDAGWPVRIGLALALLGLLGAAGHGLGVAPLARPLRLVLSPGFAWPAALLGPALMAAAERM